MQERTNNPPVVRCPGCGLVQFWPAGKERCVKPNCRREVNWRLTAKLELEPLEPVEEAASFFSMKAFGLRITMIRMGKGLSQAAMAARVGLPRSYISKMETAAHTPYIGQVERIAAALEITPAQLLDERSYSAEDLVRHSSEVLEGRETFMASIAELVPGIEPCDLLILERAAKAMAEGQYTLPEWMRV